MEILISGAAGNLGTLTARHLLTRGHSLRLMVHQTPIAADLAESPRVRQIRADLEAPGTLREAVKLAAIIL